MFVVLVVLVVLVVSVVLVVPVELLSLLSVFSPLFSLPPSGRGSFCAGSFSLPLSSDPGLPGWLPLVPSSVCSLPFSTSPEEEDSPEFPCSVCVSLRCLKKVDYLGIKKKVLVKLICKEPIKWLNRLFSF